MSANQDGQRQTAPHRPGPSVMPPSLESLMKRTRRTRTTVEQREVVIIRKVERKPHHFRTGDSKYVQILTRDSCGGGPFADAGGLGIGAAGAVHGGSR